MVKSVMINDDVHRNLLRVQTIISTKRKYNMNLGDIVSIFFNRDPEEIANDVIELSESIPLNSSGV